MVGHINQPTKRNDMEYEDKIMSGVPFLKAKVQEYHKLLDQFQAASRIQKYIEDQGWPKWEADSLSVTALRNGYGQLRSIIITYQSNYTEVTQRIFARAGMDLFGFEYQVEPKETN